jgi:hypothetical protein
MRAAYSPPTQSMSQLRFFELASLYCEILESEGIKAKPYRDANLPYFSKFTSVQKKSLLQSLESQIQVVTECLRGGGNLLDSWSLIWEFLKELKLAPAPDLLNHVTPDDYIAVYNQHGGMIFLTPNHLKLMSYSLEDLYCRSWLDIVRRDSRIEKILFDRVMDFVQGKRTQTLSNEDIPPHYLEESDSPDMRTATCRPKIYSPIFRDGKPAGFISVNQTIASISRLMPRPSGGPVS